MKTMNKTLRQSTKIALPDFAVVKEVKVTAKIQIEGLWLLLSLVIGLSYSAYMLGWDFISNVSNLLFISDDMQQHFLGWHLFRYDQWYWPLTLTNRLQYPLFTSIVYTDSFPLLSIILKMLSPLLSPIFIWHGLVAVVNCSLQFYFGSLILRRLRNDKYLAVIGGLFFVFSTALAYRLFKHYTLTSHWLILWSIALVLQPKIRKSELRQNLVILFLASGTHAYILMMNMLLSIGLLYKYIWQNDKNKLQLLIAEVVKFVIVVSLSLYLFGYFTLGAKSSGSTGWGDFSFNLNSWFNSLNYSTFIPGLPVFGGQAQESCQYLGLGLIIALICAGVNFIYCRYSNKDKINLAPYLGLVLVCILFMLISISTVITFNDTVLLDIGNLFTSEIFTKFFAMVRSSARFSWPVFYLVMLGAIIGSYDLLARYKQWLAWLVLSVLLLIQVADLYKLRQDLQQMVANNLARPTWDADLRSPFWQNLHNYQHLIDLFPHQQVVDNTYESYYKFGNLAARYSLTINLFYLSRGYNTEYQQQVMDFVNGNWGASDIYIVPDQILALANPQILPYCRQIDGYNVCVRN